MYWYNIKLSEIYLRGIYKNDYNIILIREDNRFNCVSKVI